MAVPGNNKTEQCYTSTFRSFDVFSFMNSLHFNGNDNVNSFPAYKWSRFIPVIGSLLIIIFWISYSFLILFIKVLYIMKLVIQEEYHYKYIIFQLFTLLIR